MNKKLASLLAAVALSWLSASGVAVAEDKIYYGSGDGNNTGNITGINWILNNDYRHYGGHQWFYTAYTKDGTASNNLLTVNGGTYTVNGDTSSGSGKYSNYFYGGMTENSGSATGNGIIINNGNFVNESGTWQAAGIYAGKATGKGYVASDNYTTINNGTFQGYTYIAPGLGYDGSDSVKNKVTINGGAFEKGVYIFGGRGYSTGNTDYNTVRVTGGSIGGYRALIWGGKADNGNARYNTVNLSGGEVASIPSDEKMYESKFTEYEQGDAEFYGGYSLSGDALYNTVNISGGSVSTSGRGLVYGGYSRAGNANYNKLNIAGGNISSKTTLIGGFSAEKNASGNTVSLSGGSGNGEVYIHGGITMNSASNATDNKITINFPARLKNVCGGVYLTGNATDGFVYNVASDGDLITGNELCITSPGVSANNIYNFETISFKLPYSYTEGSSMLTLTAAEATDLTRTDVVVSAAGDTSIAKGQAINLISSQGKINYSGQTEGTLKQGVSLNYNYTIENNSDKLQAVLGDATATDESKSPVETRTAQAAFLNRGADLLVSDGLLQAENASRSDDAAAKGKWSAFFAMQGGKYRYNTGSHVDSRGFNAILGVAREIKNSKGKLVYGFAGEYGKGKYDSYYENMRGEGDNDYKGASIFLRQKDAKGMYYEGSLRIGRTKADYTSRDFTGYEGTAVKYDSSSNYWGAHLGLGKAFKLTGKNELDVSLRYFYSRTGGDSARLTTGETYDFSAVNSHRLRLGAKIIHAFNEESKGYFGAYCEREFNGDAKAAIAGYSTVAPSLKGNSGIFELGWLHQPKKSNFTLNLGVTAACGTQRGLIGKMGLMWKI
ncbi:MAG: autotransporter outer membrane beta-barrel domain-containing protein [Selenomonadaceae bacterium]|nr:autotransporter outer membrane beta-barrel domain-containing protein [Selenomonadaceae bacterium]